MRVRLGLIAGAACVVVMPAMAQDSKPNDAQIAHIAYTAGALDVEAGKQALAITRNPEIREFAEQMVRDHSAVNEQALALVKKLKVTPEDNATSKSLKEGGEKNVANLKTLKGKAFDKAYIDHEVAYHQQVLDAVDKVLIPNAKNEELKALLVKVRPAFVAHLEHAKHVQEMVGK